jgi:hypothetical protein
MPLTVEQITQYRRDGYVCPVPVMTAAEAAGLRRKLEDFEATQGGRLEPGQRSRAFLLFKWLDDLIRDPRVLDPIEHEDTYDEDNMLTRGQAIRGIDESRAVAMPLRAGEMSLHNYCLAHGSGPNLSRDRRIGVSMHFMPPETKQVVGGWDCAALVRGTDRFGHFAHTPVPARDFDPPAVAFHARAAGAMREVLYAGAARKLQRL